jgi:hypothetical protein
MGCISLYPAEAGCDMPFEAFDLTFIRYAERFIAN